MLYDTNALTQFHARTRGISRELLTAIVEASAANVHGEGTTATVPAEPAVLQVTRYGRRVVVEIVFITGLVRVSGTPSFRYALEAGRVSELVWREDVDADPLVWRRKHMWERWPSLDSVVSSLRLRRRRPPAGE